MAVYQRRCAVSILSLEAWPNSHEIRVVDGKVKYVHTVTVMRDVGS
jgi:hypothetical protein